MLSADKVWLILLQVVSHEGGQQSTSYERSNSRPCRGSYQTPSLSPQQVSCLANFSRMRSVWNWVTALVFNTFPMILVFYITSPVSRPTVLWTLNTR